MDTLKALYQDLILDHGTKPRNCCHPPHITHRAAGVNPLCGDKLDLMLHLQQDKIIDIGFEGEGCAISMASCSLMTELVKHQSRDDALTLFRYFQQMILTEELDDIAQEQLGKIIVLQGVKAYPSRVKCATLAWHALKAALLQQADISTES